MSLTNGGTRGHPVAGHLTVGKPTAKELQTSASTYTGELTCLVCHDPHKGASGQRFVGRGTEPREACVRCHRR